MTRTHIITGSFGAGKTTAIRWLMAHKPESELWVVVLNEFTDAGIDALSVAQSSRGSYDVRLVAGGCLCCVGELEFSKQLTEILRLHKPARLLIEPSGAAHAADIIDALGAYQAQGALTLDSIVCLIDPLDAKRLLSAQPTNDWSQIQAADVLLLSKPDRSDAAQQSAFDAIVAAQYPEKRYVGVASHGELPLAALQHYERTATFSLLPLAAPVSAPRSRTIELKGYPAMESTSESLGLAAVQWLLPGELSFARSVLEPRFKWLLQAYPGRVRRMKGVFRTGPGPSCLMQSVGEELALEDTGYRRDSRVEIVFTQTPSDPLLDAWRAVLRDAANPPRS